MVDRATGDPRAAAAPLRTDAFPSRVRSQPLPPTPSGIDAESASRSPGFERISDRHPGAVEILRPDDGLGFEHCRLRGTDRARSRGDRMASFLVRSTMLSAFSSKPPKRKAAFNGVARNGTSPRHQKRSAVRRWSLLTTVRQVFGRDLAQNPAHSSLGVRKVSLARDDHAECRWSTAYVDQSTSSSPTEARHGLRYDGRAIGRRRRLRRPASEHGTRRRLCRITLRSTSAATCLDLGPLSAPRSRSRPRPACREPEHSCARPRPRPPPVTIGDTAPRGPHSSGGASVSRLVDQLVLADPGHHGAQLLAHLLDLVRIAALARVALNEVWLTPCSQASSRG